MATQIRQSNLFAAEDWKVVYEAFRVIDLQSYDYDTIREAMINHLRVTYPDNFNDWIGNQEFIFILDTLCFLGQNLAFRMDLNTRENFIDTAERRESVLRLANMLSYSPRRNYPSRGLVKLTEVTTTQDVRDSNGISLASRTIKWNDPLNPDWYEQFIIVLNANFSESNPFGDPVKRLTLDGLQTHLYRMNTIEFSSAAEPFTATVNGQSMNFEVVNPDIDTDGVIIERHPNPQESRYMIYRNDGNGFSSPDTGFFMMFKQGTLKFDDYLFSSSIESRVQDIDVTNINELDVWVQQITDDGIVSKEWTKVPTAQNIMYNSVSQQIPDIFSVVTRDNDQVSLRFPDSESGTIPRGTYRSWYRVSNGLSYTIKTTDIQNKSVSYLTRNANQSVNEESTLEISFSLQYQIQNAQAQETIDQIRVRAPQTYYTSNRLITGEDYNIGPMRQGNLVKKAKSINRTYSGHSHFIDVNDPTGKYQNTNIFADDGVIYRDTNSAFTRSSESLPSNKPESAIIAQKLQPLLSYAGLRQLYDEQTGFWDNDKLSRGGFRLQSIGVIPEWNADLSKAPYGTIGAFDTDFQLGPPQQGMLIKFANQDDDTEFVWASIISINEFTGEIQLSKVVPSTWSALEYYSPLRTTFTTEETNNIISQMYTRTDFGLWYNPSTTSWNVETSASFFDIDADFDIQSNHSLVKVEYNGNSWDFITRGVDYVFVGGEHVKFFFVNTNKLSDVNSGIAQQDFIKVLRSNPNPENGLAYEDDIEFYIDSVVTQEDGQYDPDRVFIKAKDQDSFGVPNEPEIFKSILPDGSSESVDLFWRLADNNDEQFISLPDADFFIYDPSYDPSQPQYKHKLATSYLTSMEINRPSGTVFYYTPADIFIKYSEERASSDISTLTSSTVIDTSTRTAYLAANKLEEVFNYRHRIGRTNLMYQWKHYAADDYRIDPAITNIMDTYVLTTEYSNQLTYWVNSTNPGEMPKPPTSAELKSDFADIEQIKAVSDSVVWHSGNFVPLFGSNAREEYRSTFRVVRALGSRFSDDEIRQQVIRLINEYFNVDNWDFGETFYFTELSTYIHQQLATDISSIVIVPKNSASKFGTLFQISNEPNELFVSTAKVEDVEIVNSITSSNIQIGQ